MNKFIISDTHFQHKNAYVFVDAAGERIRPWATNCDDGDEYMVEKWNSVVRSEDTVYHLGDVAIPRRGLEVLSRLNGRKVLIRGNHDIFSLKDYAKHFDDVRGVGVFDGVVMTHVPIHPESLAHWARGNVHGHLHKNRVMLNGEVDPRYLCVSVEWLNATPMEWSEMKDRLVADSPSGHLRGEVM